MSIPNGNAWVEFTLGTGEGANTYTLPYVSIQSWESKPVYAEDNTTIMRYEQTVSGTALISDGSASFASLKADALKVPGKVDHVKVRVTSDGGTETLIDASAPDSLNGPLMSFTMTELNGRNSAVASFTIVVNTAMAITGETSNCILSHRWVQSFSLDEAGYMTRTVTGSLAVDLSSTASDYVPSTGPADVSGKAPWADLFRKAVLPLMYAAPRLVWRRQSQTFAYNETGNQLIYTIVDKQATQNLPNGAYTGNADFTYERTMSQLAYATLRFTCELTGSATSDPRNLIWAAVVIAQSRINFVTARFDRISVQELDLLDKRRIRLEITALAPASGSDPASGIYGVVPLASMVGRYFSVVRTQPWQPDAYGGYQGVAGAPHYAYNTVSAKNRMSSGNLPAAYMIGALTDYVAPGTPTIIMEGGDSSLSSANNAMYSGPFAGMAKASFGLGDTYEGIAPTTVERSQTVTNVSINTGMERLPTLYMQGADFYFQAGKPEVIIEEVMTTKRTNEPPERIVRPVPAGFIMLSQEWKVNLGEIDTGGHRTFIGVYTRRMKAIDGGGATSNGFASDGTKRTWWSPSKTVTAPLALGFDTSSDFQYATKTVLEETHTQSYKVGDREAYA